MPFVPEAVQGPAARLDSYDSPIPMTGAAATYGVALTPMATVLHRMFGDHGSNTQPFFRKGVMLRDDI